MGSTLFHLIALSRVPAVGPIIGRLLVSYCGSPEAVFRTPVRELARIPQVGLAIAQHLQEPGPLREAEQELQRMEAEGVRAVGYLDSDYPGRLRHFEESPLVLYSRGNPDLHPLRTVGIVGTRRPTPHGRLLTEELVAALAGQGIAIISGMAHGIDSAAHHAALQYDLPTIGVLGHGLHTLYPAAHRELARRMEAPSGLITEFPWSTRPDKENFPMRNRVIAAMSDALIVVESKEKGGSMITAEFANRYNKDVFAVPGRVQDLYSRGCNLLIKRHKAHLLEESADLLEIMRWDPPAQRAEAAVQAHLFDELDEVEQQLLALLAGQSEMAIDDLGFRMNMTPGSVSALLLDMEFRGLVQQLPGKRYLLTAGSRQGIRIHGG